VTGYAKKIETATVKFIAFTLDGTNPEIDKSETFSNGESGYLYFRSPENGFVIVFYDDLEKVQRCIPYNYSSDNFSLLTITGNTFFSARGKMIICLTGI